MKKFKVKLGNNSAGINAISLVDQPANEKDFIKLGKDSKIIKLESDDKMVVTGAVLIPDQEIYRNSTFCKGECTIEFDADTILEMSKLFLRGDVDNKQTIQHLFPTDQAYIIESWVVADKDKDKSLALGLDVPVGTWIVSYQITDTNLWDAIKNGDINGFSIEADSMDFIELSLSADIPTANPSGISDEDAQEFINYFNMKMEELNE